MKQTAVEWLVNEIEGLDTAVSYHYFKEKVEQAKEMEKQQQERMYSEEEVMDMFHNLSMHLPLHYEFLVKEQFKNK